MPVSHPRCVPWFTGDSIASRPVRDIQGGRGGASPLYPYPVL